MPSSMSLGACSTVSLLLVLVLEVFSKSRNPCVGITIDGAFESSLLKRNLNAPEEPKHAEASNRGFMDARVLSMGESLWPEVVMCDCWASPQPTARAFGELGGAT